MWRYAPGSDERVCPDCLRLEVEHHGHELRLGLVRIVVCERGGALYGIQGLQVHEP